ncbi:tetratricopeptide repeat protein [Erythrobacter sp. NFXS35]|uniref:tetratricopeptide repeat protein n=1 Tax=Erythrobacter sp. NFXS35 TaxID=2818436 RepID=UPI0032DF9349
MTFRPSAIALLVALALTGCSGGQSELAPQSGPASGEPVLTRLLGRADEAMAGGDLAVAGRLLDEARAIAPENADLWVAIARLRFRGGEHLTAIEAADRALQLGPDHAPALLMRALMVRDAHGFADALPWFEAALAVDRTNADVWAGYAATLGDYGRYRDMLDAVRELADRAPDDRRIFYLQAVLAQRGGRPVLARSLLERSGMAARGVPAAVLLDALISLDQGNHDSAAQQLEVLFARQPANARLRQLLARALLLSGRNAEVVERFAAEAAQPEASAYFAMIAGRAYEQMGDRARAAPLLERAFAASSAAPVALADRPGLPEPTADLRRRSAAGDWTGARNMAQDFRIRFPASADFAQLVGDAALGGGDAAAALEAYAPAARMRRPWHLTRKAAHAYRRTGDDIAADTLLARHVAGEPDNIAALAALADALAVRKEWERAALLLDHAIALGGGHDPALLVSRGEVAHALGQNDAAERFATLAADLRPPALTRR